MELKKCFPAEVRLLSEGNIRSHTSSNKPRTTWFLDISGPFCWYLPMKKSLAENHVRMERLTDQISAMLCANVVGTNSHGSKKGSVITVTVLIDDATRNELIRREYEKATTSRSRR